METRLRDEQFWLMTGCLLLLSFVAFSFAMYFTRTFMIPFVFSLFVTAMVSPIDKFIVQRFHSPRWCGYVVSLLLIFFAMVLVMVFLTYAVKSITSTLQSFDISAGQFADEMDGLLRYIGVPKDYANARELLKPFQEAGPSMLGSVAKMLQSFISGSVLVLLFSLFILMGRNPQKLISNEMYVEVERSILKYLNIKFFISLATGVSVYVTFLFLGLPLAYLFALLVFILNFIPSIGSIVATILPLPLAMITPGFTNLGVFLVFMIPTIIQNFFGNLLEPKLQGEGLKLHPVTILLALGFWGVVWGPVGMLLAAPITAAMRISLEKFKMTRGLALLMGGKLPSDLKKSEETDENV